MPPDCKQSKARAAESERIGRKGSVLVGDFALSQRKNSHVEEQNLLRGGGLFNLLEAITKLITGDAEQFGGPRLVPATSLEGLADQS